MATYLIWLDDNGGEIKRKHKGRGRAPSGFSKGGDGNWYCVASQTPDEPVKQPRQKRPQKRRIPPGPHFLIWLDEDGNETKREPRSGRGRPPKDFTRREDGNWYYEPSWKKVVRLEEEKEQDREPEELAIPRAHHVKAANRTTVDAFLRACHTISNEQDDGVLILISPILTGDTGLAELDSMHGQPLFHRIDIDTEAKTVAVYNVSAPGGPYLIVEDALAIDVGDRDAT